MVHNLIVERKVILYISGFEEYENGEGRVVQVAKTIKWLLLICWPSLERY